MSQNTEKNVFTRIVTQLKNIDGTDGTYNYDVNNRVYQEFKLWDQCNEYPSIYLMGQTMPDTTPRWRTYHELPLEWEIWGYVQSEDEPVTKANELLSDIRTAVTTDETLNSLVKNLTYSSETFAEGNVGITVFKITAKVPDTP